MGPAGAQWHPLFNKRWSSTERPCFCVVCVSHIRVDIAGKITADSSREFGVVLLNFCLDPHHGLACRLVLGFDGWRGCRGTYWGCRGACGVRGGVVPLLFEELIPG